MSDLTNADWDTFYEFPVETSNSVISSVIGLPYTKSHVLKRVIILTKNGEIAFSDMAKQEGTEIPIYGELEISCKPFENPYTKCSPDTLFEVIPTMPAGHDGLHFYGPSYSLLQIN